MPRLVALLGEEENKLYGQVCSRWMCVDARRRQIGSRPSMCTPMHLEGGYDRVARVHIRVYTVPPVKRFDLEACLVLFTRSTRSTLRRASGQQGGEERGTGVDLQGTTMSHTPAGRCVHKSVCTPGPPLCVYFNQYPVDTATREHKS